MERIHGTATTPFRLVAVSEARWTLVIHTIEPMPVRLSALFGEWLYLLRAALDGAAYYVAVRDSGQNPPPNERSIYFPIKTDAAKYDSQGHRQALVAFSDQTFADLRSVQPFNAQPDHKSNVLWWIEELARIDRHRYGHTLAPHIVKVRVGLKPPLTLVNHHLPEPVTDGRRLTNPAHSRYLTWRHRPNSANWRFDSTWTSAMRPKTRSM